MLIYNNKSVKKSGLIYLNWGEERIKRRSGNTKGKGERKRGESGKRKWGREGGRRRGWEWEKEMRKGRGKTKGRGVGKGNEEGKGEEEGEG